MTLVILTKLLPIILIFLIGYFLKLGKVFKKEDGELLLKIVFYISSPAIYVLSISQIDISMDFIYFPIIAVLMYSLMYTLGILSSKIFKLDKRTTGTYLIGTMIMNIGFVLPFFIVAYGEKEAGRILMFDFGNVLIALTFVYFIACLYGAPENKNNTLVISKILRSPPMWGLVLGILLNITHIAIPPFLFNFFNILGNTLVPLSMLALGLSFNPKLSKPVPAFTVIFIRMVIGLIIGIALVKLFNIQGINKVVVILATSAPIGVLTLTYSSLEKLDTEFAASLVSLGILIGMIYVPAIILFLT